MNLFKSILATCVLTSAAFAAFTGAAAAQDYPNKPIKLIVSFGAGGPTDIAARMVAEVLSRKLGQPVVIENKIGAQGRIGTDYVATQKPDGYTLHFNSSTMVYFPIFYKDWKRDLNTSYTYIGAVAESQILVLAPGNLPVSNLKELAAYYKARPGKINVGYIAPGPWEFLFYHLNEKYGWKMERVPYKSSTDAKMATMQGDIQIYTDSVITAINEVRDGKLKALGILMKQRSSDLPNTQTITEADVTDFKLEPVTWFGLVGPAGVPPEIVGKLNRVLTEMANDPEFAAKLKDVGLRPLTMTAPEMKASVAGELSLGLRLAKQYKIEPQ